MGDTLDGDNVLWCTRCYKLQLETNIVLKTVAVPTALVGDANSSPTTSTPDIESRLEVTDPAISAGPDRCPARVGRSAVTGGNQSAQNTAHHRPPPLPPPPAPLPSTHPSHLYFCLVFLLSSFFLTRIEQRTATWPRSSATDASALPSGATMSTTLRSSATPCPRVSAELERANGYWAKRRSTGVVLEDGHGRTFCCEERRDSQLLGDPRPWQLVVLRRLTHSSQSPGAECVSRGRLTSRVTFRARRGVEIELLWTLRTLLLPYPLSIFDLNYELMLAHYLPKNPNMPASWYFL